MDWRTSSYSAGNGACVEAGQDWRTSSGSDSSACVEVTRCPGIRCVPGEFIEVAPHVLVRDTKDRRGPVLRVPPAAWRDLTRRIKAGDAA